MMDDGAIGRAELEEKKLGNGEAKRTVEQTRERSNLTRSGPVV